MGGDETPFSSHEKVTDNSANMGYDYYVYKAIARR